MTPSAPGIEAGIRALILADEVLAPMLGTRFYVEREVPKNTAYPVGNGFPVGGNSTPTFDTCGPQRERWEFNFGANAAAGGRAQARACVDRLCAVLDPPGGFTGELPNGFYLTTTEFLNLTAPAYDSDKLVSWVGCEFYLHYNL